MSGSGFPIDKGGIGKALFQHHCNTKTRFFSGRKPDFSIHVSDSMIIRFQYFMDSIPSIVRLLVRVSSPNTYTTGMNHSFALLVFQFIANI